VSRRRVWTPGVTNHFVRRAVERVRCTATEAKELGLWILDAIDKGDPEVPFVARVSTDGCRLFRFHARGGQTFFALVNTEVRTCVTVMPAGFEVGRQGRGTLKLRRADL
jgi:hypothetical protein